jgi:uncharacterized membrane protein
MRIIFGIFFLGCGLLVFVSQLIDFMDKYQRNDLAGYEINIGGLILLSFIPTWFGIKLIMRHRQQKAKQQKI